MTEYTLRWEFPVDDSASGLARHHTADALMAWGLDRMTDEAVLVVSELVTNAVHHARTPGWVELDWDGSTLRIGVHDFDATPPTPRRWDPDDPGGLGLRIVDDVTRGWRITNDGAGKTIWCEMGASPGPIRLSR